MDVIDLHASKYILSSSFNFLTSSLIFFVCAVPWAPGGSKFHRNPIPPAGVIYDINFLFGLLVFCMFTTISGTSIWNLLQSSSFCFPCFVLCAVCFLSCNVSVQLPSNASLSTERA